MNWFETWKREILVGLLSLLLCTAVGTWSHWTRQAPPEPPVKLKPDCGQKHRHWTSKESDHEGAIPHLTDCVDTE